jgi:signal transduction histidine kinase
MLLRLIGYSLSAISVIVLALRPVPVWADTPEYLSHELEVHGNPYARKYVVGDCTGDGYDEILTIGTPGEEGTTDNALLWGFEGQARKAMWQLPVYVGEITSGWVTDLESDGQIELLIGRMDGAEAWIDVYEAPTRRFIRTSERIPTPDYDESGKWSGGFEVEGCFYLDGDGVRDIVCSLTAGRDRKPRCLLALSGANLGIIRRFDTASMVYEVIPCWPSSDPSDLVILLRTNAVGNKNREGTFVDTVSYLYALDREFNMLWFHAAVEHGDSWGADAGDIDSDHGLEVVFSRQSQAGGVLNPYRMEVRDLRTDSLERYLDLPVEISDIEICDLDRDGTPEILAALKDNSIRLYNQHLDLLKSHEEEAPILLRAVVDLDLDGSPEIVLRRGAATLMVMDGDFNHLAMREFTAEVRRVDHALVNASTRYLLARAANHMHYMSYKPAGPFALGASGRWMITWFWVTVGVLGGVGIGVLIAGARWRPKKTSKRALEARRARDQLLSALSAFGHSGVARSNLERLAQYCEAGPGVKGAKRTAYMQRLTDITENYRGFTRGMLERIVALSGHPGSSKSFDVNKLRSNLQRLDRLIPSEGFIGELDGADGDKISESARALLGEVKSLRRGLLDSYRTDVIGALCRVVAAARERLQRLGVEHLEMIFRSGGVAHVDEEALKTSLEILLVNAAEAMKGSERRELRVEVDGGGGRILLTVSDTGCGLEREDWERIFERDVTTKGDGHGLGLYHARETLGRYGSTVHVDRSEIGVGTVMLIRLKAVPEAEVAQE